MSNDIVTQQEESIPVSPMPEQVPSPDDPLKESTSPRTPTQQVLSTRTPVAEIIKWFVIMLDPSQEKDRRKNNQDEPNRHRHTSLCDLVTVNRLWFDQTIPYIWKSPTTKNCSFHQRFAKVNEQHLQTYANFVERGYLIAVSWLDDQVNSNRILRNVTFPRLNHIDLVLRFRERLLCFPRLNAPGLKSVRVRIAWVLKSKTSEKIYYRFGHRRMPRLNGCLGHRLAGYLQVCH